MQTPEIHHPVSVSAPRCCDVPVLSLDRRASPDTADNELYTLRLRSPGWGAWHPGQFVMIRPKRSARSDVVWARPFSISQANAEELRVVFQVAGRGTKILLELERGELVTVWGPLGNAFAVSRSGPTLLLAGGIGIAPFVGYIENHPAPETLRLEFGHRLPLACYPFAECLLPGHGGENASAFNARSHYETCADDLSRFIAAIGEAVADTASRNGLVLACGPMPFLKSVQKLVRRYGAKAQLSLETRMACGIGACLGCVVKAGARTAGEAAAPTPEEFRYTQTCTNGPVFWADELDLED